MKLKSVRLWTVIIAILVFGGYYGYEYMKRKQAERAMKEAIELGCADVIKQFEQEQDAMAEDIAKLIEKMEVLDIDDLEDDLNAIQEELKDLKEDLVANK